MQFTINIYLSYNYAKFYKNSCNINKDIYKIAIAEGKN